MHWPRIQQKTVQIYVFGDMIDRDTNDAFDFFFYFLFYLRVDFPQWNILTFKLKYLTSRRFFIGMEWKCYRIFSRASKPMTDNE